MPTTAPEVAEALQQALGFKARVRLQVSHDGPSVVVVGRSGQEVWLDLSSRLAANPWATADEIVDLILASERWTRFNLGGLQTRLVAGYGLDLREPDWDHLLEAGPYDADELTDAVVIRALGSSPQTSGHREAIRNIVKTYFGPGPE